jgi:hypothetical protein
MRRSNGRRDCFVFHYLSRSILRSFTMFQISAKNQTYTADVRVEKPGDKGKAKVQVFVARFKRVTQDELDDIHVRLQDGGLKDAALIREVMVGWEKVLGEDGRELEFNDDNLTLVLDDFPVRPTVVKTFFATINSAVTKN